MLRTCGTCAYRTLANGKCPTYEREMGYEDPGCPLYSTTITRCALCGNIIMFNAVIDIDEEGKEHIICRKCVHEPPCNICKNAQTCPFETDFLCKEPKYITQEIRQGNMIMQTQVINVARIKATCPGCVCYNEPGVEHGTHCLKQLGCGCKKHQPNWRK